MSITFRPARPDDVEPLLLAMRSLYGPSRFDPASTRAALTQLLAEPSSGQTVLILRDDQFAGYLVLTLGYSLEFAGRFALLDELYVFPEHRGHGVGTAGLAYAQDFCRQRGIKALRLEVQRDNGPAQSLYRKAGFRGHNRDLLSCWVADTPPQCTT
jgi:ribosomal protein S18 acetylase RimI-like enzyme